ncbi:hypothetical protein ACN47E_002343, partial [Coniothyrium glycines]
MPAIQHPVKINVDLGEGYGNFKCGPDEELIPLIDHANVACGFHAGDPLIMQETVRLCKKSVTHPVSSIRTCIIPPLSHTQISPSLPPFLTDNLPSSRHNIAIGAHPGLPDIQGFGRREIAMTPEELTACVRYVKIQTKKASSSSP